MTSKTTQNIELIASDSYSTRADGQFSLKISNDSAVADQAEQIAQASVIELNFPVFSDGRAFSQAVQLRKRLGFRGDIRATGDVLIDQLLQMQRSGFSSAVLRADKSAEHGRKLLAHYADFYQGDVQRAPAFVRGILA
jgi:uncharacterized protein (DUF934 family)